MWKHTEPTAALGFVASDRALPSIFIFLTFDEHLLVSYYLICEKKSWVDSLSSTCRILSTSRNNFNDFFNSKFFPLKCQRIGINIRHWKKRPEKLIRTDIFPPLSKWLVLQENQHDLPVARTYISRIERQRVTCALFGRQNKKSITSC